MERARRFRTLLMLWGLGTALLHPTARGADHLDSPSVRMRPGLDINDVYVFPSHLESG